MATIADIGVPGQPATNLTAWQAAVRDTLTVRQTPLTLQSGWSGTIWVSRQGSSVICSIDNLQKSTAPAGNELIANIPPGYRPIGFVSIPTINVNAGSGTSQLYAAPTTLNMWTPAAAQTFKHYTSVSWKTNDA